MTTPWLGRAALLGLTLAACFGNPQTLGLPCTEDSACFEGLVCGPSGLCEEPSTGGSTTTGDGDGDPGDGDTGDGEPGDGDGDSGDGDGDTGDGDGDGDGDSGDGDGGDGDGDGEPVCGNGIREGDEVCDGTDFGDMTCADFEFGGGMLACRNCDLDLTQCCLAAGQSCELLDTNCCGNMQCNLMFECA